MPYATRRISVNLEQLGVTLPRTHARSANRQASASSATTTPAATPTATTPPALTPATSTTAAASPNAQSDDPPSKRVKRSHTVDSTSAAPSVASRPRARKAASISERRPALPSQPTPPPSPKALSSTHIIDKEGIKDDIVIAVLEQLEATGNRPHLIKELCAVLINKLASVEGSQNPIAIISSRLTNFLKRPWTPIAPCPLTKEQVVVHPRRVYYYLTTMPRQPIPEYVAMPPTPRHVISPSISSGPDEENDPLIHLRDEPSPSPELESNSVGDELVTQGVSTMHFSDVDFDHNMSLPEPVEPTPTPRHQDAPVLELDEREFSQTAGEIRQRKESEQASGGAAEKHNASSQTLPTNHGDGISLSQDPEEHHSLRNQEDAVLLFGQSQQNMMEFASSPMIRPQQQQNTLSGLAITTAAMAKKSPMLTCQKMDMFGDWNDLKSPETVDLAELDYFLDRY